MDYQDLEQTPPALVAAAEARRKPDLGVRPPRPWRDPDLDNEALVRAVQRGPHSDEAERRSRWFQPFSRGELVAQGAFLGLGLTDWGQTIRFTQDPAWKARGVYEVNPVLGRHPSRARVNTLIPLGLAAHTLAAWALPRPYRRLLQGAGLVGEAGAVGTNHLAGIRPALPWK